jgi:hypothetical protein
MLSQIYLIHIFFVAPLLLYSGYLGTHLSAKCHLNEYSSIFILLMLVGLVVLMYHGYKYLKIKQFI